MLIGARLDRRHLRRHRSVLITAGFTDVSVERVARLAGCEEDVARSCLRRRCCGRGVSARASGAAVIVASFVYDAAMRDKMLPRKPIEAPLPKEPEKKEE